MSLDNLERGAFLALFNRSGFVLDFTTNSFDVFTLEHVGVGLCSKYNLSKGKSLNAFLNDNSYSNELTGNWRSIYPVVFPLGNT